jgi:fascin 1/2
MSGSTEETLKWTVGLINSGNKYLTAEQFQGKVTCNGNTLKKKQIWSVENQGGEVIALKGSTGKFLTSDKDGKLDCNEEEIGPDQKFTFVTQDDGKVAIRSVTHGRYVGGSGDNMTGFDQTISATNLFTIQLAIHPQVNIRSINRKTYMHYNEGTEEICCNEVIPWGYDATIILEFYKGQYALRAANTKYLKRTGELVEAVSADTLYTVIFKGTQVAFRDNNGKYLTAVGASAVVQSRKSTIGKDELFEFMDSKPQVQLLASNGKLLSIREGIEVRAKQTEPTDKEIFQMEPVSNTDFSGNVKWCFRSCNNLFWNSGSSISSDAPSCAVESTHFTVEWKGEKIALKASNGKYIGIKPNGQMCANNETPEDKCLFLFQFINRPILVIRGNYGFVGVKGTSGTLECNRSQYDVFLMTSESVGKYSFKGANGKYFKIESDSTLSMNGDTATEFYLELRALSRMCIVDPKSGRSFKGQQNGSFTVTGDGISDNTLWEY